MTSASDSGSSYQAQAHRAQQTSRLLAALAHLMDSLVVTRIAVIDRGYSIGKLFPGDTDQHVVCRGAQKPRSG